MPSSTPETLQFHGLISRHLPKYTIEIGLNCNCPFCWLNLDAYGSVEVAPGDLGA